ncbi:anti-phage dCTP deaminase [Telluribacter humicola]|uniref:anti-phage dCTP deaminase n=1 Tax=Telluribacter humicola TaxID=1720261 RepID=UPI001A96F764|nr:anti-phage dCTP deaminase [Telluribacter humicola]
MELKSTSGNTEDLKLPIDKNPSIQINKTNMISDEYNDSEIIIGLVGAIGVEYKEVKTRIKDRLINYFNYEVEEIRISTNVIEGLPIFSILNESGHYNRINHFMNIGNQARENYKDNSILALGASKIINSKREKGKFRKAYIIDSLKHPDEVKLLREVYGQGFYLVGVFSDFINRTNYLMKELSMTSEEAKNLIQRDENDSIGGHGQHTSDTYHLSDFFVQVDSNRDKLKASIFRFLDIIFGKPTITPLFEEFAMFMAFTSSLRSADLSRQVGAVLTKGDEIIATGANDAPKFGGGLYWPYIDTETNEYKDVEQGRDYTRGEDSNVIERLAIIDEILEKASLADIEKDTLREILHSSRLKDLIEFGRAVHAEMEVLMVCSRNNTSTKSGTLYCTTFPCHNCAKHIIAAGIEKVVYIEPYPKSKALDFHSESIRIGIKSNNKEEFTFFEPFIGIGPRKFFDLFSMNLGSGRTIKRKDKEGKLLNWDPKTSKPRVQLFPISYLDREIKATDIFDQLIKAQN